MQINISTRHGHLSQDSQAAIEEKVKNLPRLYDRITSVEVVVDVENSDSPSVEIRASAEKHDDFVATETAETMQAAIDVAIHKMEQQLRKFKEKHKDHRRPSHRDQALAAEAQMRDDDSDSDED